MCVSDAPEGKPRESWSYAGEVWTDGDGRAVVVLPPFARIHTTTCYRIDRKGRPETWEEER